MTDMLPFMIAVTRCEWFTLSRKEVAQSGTANAYESRSERTLP